MRNVLLPVALLLFFPPIVCAQSNATTMEFVTYFPSPYGAYRELRLFPSAQPAPGDTMGVMYYDQNYNRTRYHNDTQWGNISASAPCVLVPYTSTSGSCPAGYGTFEGVQKQATGTLLCCQLHD